MGRTKQSLENRLERIEYRRGTFEKGTKIEDLPLSIWKGDQITAEFRDAIEAEDLFSLGGVHGDETAGWPVQIDELKLVTADETVEIIVLNRAIILLLYDDDEVRRIHRVLYKLERSKREPMADSSKSSGKAAWSGRVVSVQPRIRLSRSFDERSHSYLGMCC